MKLYRATTNPIASYRAHFTEDLRDAIKYTTNPGFGGPYVYEYDIRPRSHLNAEGRGGLVDLAEAVLAHLDEDGLYEVRRKTEPDWWDPVEDGRFQPKPRDLMEVWNDSGYQYVFHVLENTRLVQQTLAGQYDWISFMDDFPPGSTTWKYLGRGEIRPVALRYVAPGEEPPEGVVVRLATRWLHERAPGLDR